MSSFQPLEVVGRGSEAQLQVAENLNKLTWDWKGWKLELTMLTLSPPGYLILISATRNLFGKFDTKYLKILIFKHSFHFPK